ncbi:RfaG Glycosyltransferase [Methylophilaceae bacterium]
MRNFRIAIVIPNLCEGGAERVAVNLANSFVKRGYLVDIILMSAVGQFIDDLLPDVHVVDLKVNRMRGLLVPLIQYLRNNRPNSLLANMWPITSFAMLACKLAMVDTRLVVVEHTTWSRSEICRLRYKRWQVSTLMHLTFKFVDGVVAVSQSAADDLARFANLKRDNITVIYNPIVDLHRVMAVDLLPQILGWSGSSKLVLSVGKLKAEKDYETLLKAFALLLLHLDAKLLILGEGECRAALELKAQQLGIENDIFMPGSVKDVVPFYQQADLFVLSSVTEGLPTVVIEALAVGLPVVSTDCLSGPREILSDGKYGELVPVGDVKALASAMLNSMNKKHNRIALMERAKDFSIDKAVDKYVDILLG